MTLDSTLLLRHATTHSLVAGLHFHPFQCRLPPDLLAAVAMVVSELRHNYSRRVRDADDDRIIIHR